MAAASGSSSTPFFFPRADAERWPLSSTTVPARVSLPNADDRRAAVKDIFGDDAIDDAFVTFRRVLSGEVARLFAREVLPVVRPVWPGVDDATFLPKWRNGFDVYCGLALSVLVVSRRRPASVAWTSRALRALGADERAIVAVGTRALPVLFGLVMRRWVRRAALAAAWIMILDEALDDGLADVPVDQRADVLVDVVRHATDGSGADPPGRWRPGVEVGAVAALGAALAREARDAGDEAGFRRVLDGIAAWARGEGANLQGNADPLGLGHRSPGVVGSMGLIAWALGPVVDDVEHRFLVVIAELGQMVDDWLDVEKDLAQGRVTPATTGRWTPTTMRDALAAGEALLGRLLDEAGEGGSAWRAVVLRTYRAQLQHTARCLVATP
jgi:hypothetical protein